MRLIDVAIPKFDDNVPLNSPLQGLSTNFQLPPLFRRGDQEYHVGYEDDDDLPQAESKAPDSPFFDAPDESLQVKCCYDRSDI